MAIVIDGDNRTIILSVDTDFQTHSIYRKCILWMCQLANTKYLVPMSAGGHAPVVPGVYSDDLYALINGYKIQPYGYPPNTQVTIRGTLSTSDGTPRAIPPDVGSPVQFEFMVATYATTTIVPVGSGMSQEEHDHLLNNVATQEDIIVFG